MQKQLGSEAVNDISGGTKKVLDDSCPSLPPLVVLIWPQPGWGRATGGVLDRATHNRLASFHEFQTQNQLNGLSATGVRSMFKDKPRTMLS